MGLKRHRHARKAVEAYVIYDEGERVEMALDHHGLWWFRHTYKERVWLSKSQFHDRGWHVINKLEPWYCPEVQPDPAYMPGSRAKRIRGKYRMLPTPIIKPSTVETVSEGHGG